MKILIEEMKRNETYLNRMSLLHAYLRNKHHLCTFAIIIVIIIIAVAVIFEKGGTCVRPLKYGPFFTKIKSRHF